MKKIAFIINSRIRKSKKIVSDIEAVFDSTYKKKLLFTAGRGDGIKLSRQAIQEGFEYIISVGGDGTINEVINGYMHCKEDDGISDELINKIKIGVLPYGSGNDLARTLRIAADFHQLRLCVDRRSFFPIDLGYVEYVDKENNPRSRYFINIADIGMGAEVARKINSYTKLFGANFAYQRGIISTLLTYKNKEVEVSSERYQFSGKVKNLVLANGKYFGSGLGIAPQASLTSNSLSIVNIGEISLKDYFNQLKFVRKCQVLKHPAVHYGEANELSIRSPEGALPIEMDGEFIGFTPMHVSIVPGAVNFLSPIRQEK